MVKITVAPYRITAVGHAGYDEPGKDIVCAAVSALLQALAVGIERLARYDHLITKKIELEEGEAVLSVIPTKEHDQEARLLFDVFAEALLRIAQDYPEYVEVQPTEAASV